MSKSLFEERVNLKPYEYPEFLEYKEAIRHSYWVHDEFNFDGDIQDFKVECTDAERSIIKRTMLAIAQIEVSVKTFWADVYHKLPKPEVAGVGMTFAECHKEGTEILTVDGWKDFRDITEETQVAQVDPEDSSLSFTTPDRVVDKAYEGDLYEMDNQTYNFAVTPGHRFIYQTDAGYIREREVQDIEMFTSSMSLPFTVELRTSQDADELTPQEKLKIALQADGSARYYKDSDGELTRRGLSKDCYTYEISVKKERKKTRLLNLIESTGVDYREFNVNREGYVRYEIDVPVSWGDMKTFDWVDLSNVTADWCRDFIDELGLWDGCVVENTANYEDAFMVYSSTNKACADKAQAIGILAGYRATLNQRVDERKDTYKDIFSVSFATRDHFSSITAKTTTEPYKGRVYCVSVPTGCIVTRFNDKVLISGNSEVRHHDAYSHLLELLGMSGEFNRIEDISALSDRIDYLDDYMRNGEDVNSKRDFALSVLLFSIFIEHVSLFSQFLIMLSFDKHTKRFKGVANAVEATSKEEQIHGLFGVELIETMQEENPEWFDEKFEAEIKNFCRKAEEAERKVLDWIFEKGELDFLPRQTVEAFIQDKFNRSLENVGYDPIFDPDEELLEDTKWFYEEILLTKGGDFFQKRQTSYSKMTQSVSTDDLF
jgi:ribonucleoside-diphosphate reductase beta chain